jgi:hypothetical protein
MKNLSQNQKVNMVNFWRLMTTKIFKKFQHVQFSKKNLDVLDVKTELEQKFYIYGHYSVFLTKKMFAAILNSFFTVLLSMVSLYKETLSK